jgi:peptide/nickel transport system ATP-binding protein
MSQTEQQADREQTRTPLIEVEDLKTYFYLDEGVLKAVDGIDMRIDKGRTLGLVGESGCGKSMTARSIMRIVPPPGESQGRILFHRKAGNGSPSTVDLLQMAPSGREIRSIRGKDITMVFQEPMTSFSPVHTIGNQIVEAILEHRTKDQDEALEIAVDMLGKVGISSPRQRIDEYPHQLSGGMRQRAMIAMALSCNPSMLIADEPTTALDVTVQAQVIELMLSLREEFGMSMLYITHDLGVIAEVVDDMGVMYLGKMVEEAGVVDLFYEPMHPYTKALLASVPKIGRRTGRRLESIKGTVPTPINLPQRCVFYSRCPSRMKRCGEEAPELVEVSKSHRVRCFLFHEVAEAREAGNVSKDAKGSAASAAQAGTR